MPFFSTLCGNDIMKYDDVKNFHYSLKGPRYPVFPKVAHFLKQLKPIKQFKELDYFLLARKLNRFKNPYEIVALIKESLKLYNLQLIQESRNKKLQNNVYALNTDGIVYEILNDLPIGFSLGYFDVR